MVAVHIQIHCIALPILSPYSISEHSGDGVVVKVALVKESLIAITADISHQEGGVYSPKECN